MSATALLAEYESAYESDAARSGEAVGACACCDEPISMAAWDEGGVCRACDEAECPCDGSPCRRNDPSDEGLGLESRGVSSWR